MALGRSLAARASSLLVCELLCACSMSINQPRNGASLPPASSVAASVSWSSNASLDWSSFHATLDGADHTADFTLDAANSKATASLPVTASSTPATHTLVVTGKIGTLSNSFSNTDTETSTFTMQAIPAPPPAAVTSLSPTTGIVGTDVTISGAQFDPSHTVALNGNSVVSRFVGPAEIHFAIPQLTPGTYSVSVQGVGSLPLTVTAGNLTASPNPLAAIIGQNTSLTINLPVAAPPSGVTLTLAASPTGIVSTPSIPAVASGSQSQSIAISGTRPGSGTLAANGTGFTTFSLPFTSALGPALCQASPNPTGGIDLPGLMGHPSGHIPATSTPGRIVPSPDGKRAVAQFSNGFSFVDLVQCTSLGTFQSSPTAIMDIVFTPDSQFVVVDWTNQSSGSYGADGYFLFDASQIFQDANQNTPAPAIGLQTAMGTDDFAFATFAFAPPNTNTVTINMVIYHLVTPRGTQCILSGVPSNAFNVSMSGGSATIQFTGGIPGPQTWTVTAANCVVTHRM